MSVQHLKRAAMAIVLTVITSFAIPPAEAAKSSDAIKKLMAPWHGRSINDVIAVWGYPTEEKEIVGRHLVRWQVSASSGITSASSNTGDTETEPPQVKGCLLTLEVDQNKQIIGSDFFGPRGPCGSWLKKHRPADVLLKEREKARPEHYPISRACRSAPTSEQAGACTDAEKQELGI